MSEKPTTSIISLKAENIKRIKAIEIVPHGATVVIGGRNAQGKQQPVSEPVLTPNGWKPIGEIEIGDEVIGSSGSPTKILGVYPQTERKTYLVTFSDGTSTRCGPDHLWTVSRWWSSKNPEKSNILTETLALSDIVKIGLRSNYLTDYPSKRWWIPVSGPVQFADTGRDLPIDPYTLGVILGDGHIEASGYATVTSWDEEVFTSLGVSGWRSKTELGTGEWSRPLVHLGLAGKRSWEKFVPSEYLSSSVKDRTNILYGLMDTDGTATESWATYSSTSEQLANDVATLGRSLGYVCSVRNAGQKSYRYKGELKKGRVSWIVFIKSDVAPFRLKRKIERWSVSALRPVLKKFIDSVTQVDDEDSVCIKVAAEDGLYLTDDFIVTHNTSVLDCIAMALGGAAAAPAEPIRRGASKAQIILETEELTVTRKFSKSSTTLEVTNKDGLKFAGPQGVLDKLVSTLAFDPLAFVMADKKTQFKQLQTLLGIDTESIDTERKTEFDRRTQKNRDVKALAAVIDSLPMTGPARVEVKELLDELSRAEQINAGVNDLEREAMEADNQFMRADGDVIIGTNQLMDLENQVKALAARLNEAIAKKSEAEKNKNAAMERADRAERIEVAPIKERIAAAEDTNAEASKVEDRKRKQADLTVLENEAEMMTARLLELDQKRAKLLSDCPMPVPGIGFEADGVTLNDLPLDQASAAEQLKLGLAVACAMNPNLRVMLIRNGSLLDDDAMALVAKMAEDHGAQVWIERVGNDGKCTVVIEDGEAMAVPMGNDSPAAAASGATDSMPTAQRTALIETMEADGVAVAVAAPIEKPAAPVAAQLESLY